MSFNYFFQQLSLKKRIHLIFAIALLSLILTSCATAPSRTALTQQNDNPALLAFQAHEYQQNALIGRFWSPVTAEFYEWPEVARHLPRGGWLLLGEQHDHPDHHQLESFFIDYLANQGLLGHVVMEMLAVDQQYAVDHLAVAVDKLQASDLYWPEKSWPWPRYEKQVKAAIALSAGLKAGDLSSEQKLNVRLASEGIAHYSDEHSYYLAELIEQSHCGAFSAEQAMPMVSMQIARDQLMAQQLTAYRLTDKVGIFIAGSGHVRADYGVPLWLAEQVPVRSILLVAVGASEQPEDYVKNTFKGQAAAQLVFFVPGIKQVDYCAQLRS